MDKMSKYTKISISIVLIFLTAIIMSFIPDILHKEFGDILCSGNIEKDVCASGLARNSNRHGQEWHWGWRHWLWTAMGLSLFIVQFVRIIVLIDKKED